MKIRIRRYSKQGQAYLRHLGRMLEVSQKIGKLSLGKIERKRPLPRQTSQVAWKEYQVKKVETLEQQIQQDPLGGAPKLPATSRAPGGGKVEG
ncbi:hypothetical protein ES705_09416 [subsurface metagenome]